MFAAQNRWLRLQIIGHRFSCGGIDFGECGYIYINVCPHHFRLNRRYIFVTILLVIRGVLKICVVPTTIIRLLFIWFVFVAVDGRIAWKVQWWRCQHWITGCFISCTTSTSGSRWHCSHRCRCCSWRGHRRRCCHCRCYTQFSLMKWFIIFDVVQICTTLQFRSYAPVAQININFVRTTTMR